MTDGTAGGTAMVADVLPGAGQSRPEGLTAGTHLLYFFADTEIDRLLRSDGTASGNVRGARQLTNAAGSNPEGFVDFGGQAFFVAARDG